MKTKYLFDQVATKKALKHFFKNEKPKISSFGSTVNQTFEASVFADCIKKYQTNKWVVAIKNPVINKRQAFRLKFSTRGAPSGYSYALCEKGAEECQIRHGLRVSTKHHKNKNASPANIVCDIAIIKNVNLESFKTNDALPNDQLISFGEVKHMSAYAELIANFIGMVHEIQPKRLKRIRLKTWKQSEHVSAFLYVSGLLYSTAKGINLTIEQRKFDMDIYSADRAM